MCTMKLVALFYKDLLTFTIYDRAIIIKVTLEDIKISSSFHLN